MKQCCRCKLRKPHSEFHKCRNARDGLQAACKPCANSRAKEWYLTNIARPDVKTRLYEYNRDRCKHFKEFVDGIKTEMGCIACDERELCCLDLHHVRGQKLEVISTMLRRKNRSALVAELRKCVCACANCHRKIHSQSLVVSPESVAEALEKMRRLVDVYAGEMDLREEAA
jgi:hypothetical protein